MDPKKKIFIDNFSFLRSYDKFYGFVEFIDDEFGFSVRRKLKSEDHASLISIDIDKKYLNNTELHGKPLYIRATYGRISENGIIIRDFNETKISDPVDLKSEGEYFYNVENNQFYKKKRKVTPEELIYKVYKLHIKPTRLIVGFWLRSKMFFFQILVHGIFILMSKTFSSFLYLISGNKYSYEPILEEEKLNDLIIKSKWEKEGIKPETSESNKFNFFGYKASQWSIFVYSLIHLVIYFYITLSEFHIGTIDRFRGVFRNNFLSLAYVILSLSIFESLLPKFLIFLIKLFSKWSLKAKYKKLKI